MRRVFRWLVGLVVVAGICAALWKTGRFIRVRFGDAPPDAYVVFPPGTSGVGNATEVLLDGVSVGSVREVRLLRSLEQTDLDRLQLDTEEKHEGALLASVWFSVPLAGRRLSRRCTWAEAPFTGRATIELHSTRNGEPRAKGRPAVVVAEPPGLAAFHSLTPRMGTALNDTTDAIDSMDPWLQTHSRLPKDTGKDIEHLAGSARSLQDGMGREGKWTRLPERHDEKFEAILHTLEGRPNLANARDEVDKAIQAVRRFKVQTESANERLEAVRAEAPRAIDSAARTVWRLRVDIEDSLDEVAPDLR